MNRYALIGKSLKHSFSQRYFETKFEKLGITDSCYQLLELPTLDLLRENVERHRLSGFNVTVPYKQEVIPLLDGLDTVAQEIGAVNTVKVSNNKSQLIGYNTDGPAFMETLKPLLQPWHTHALVLGTGGAAKAVAWALQKLGIEYLMVSRTPEQHLCFISYDEAETLIASTTPNSQFSILINATPVGMFPNTDETPWPRADLLTDKHLCFDLIYNPSPTLFLKQAGQHGATTIDGLQMLYRQADLSFEIWHSGNDNDNEDENQNEDEDENP